MTIQNIEDVMDRILNLNKNLTEDSLRTLLSASGWDKEDIMEGIHIFKSTRGNVAPATPIINTTATFSAPAPQAPTPGISFSSNPVLSSMATEKVENNYTFNVKKTPELDSSLDKNKEINNNFNQNPPVPENKILPHEPVNTFTANMPPVAIHENKKSNLDKIIFIVLLVLILSGGLFFLYSSTNKSTPVLNTNSDINVQDIKINPNSMSSDQSVSTTTDATSTDTQNPIVSSVPQKDNSVQADQNIQASTPVDTNTNSNGSQIDELAKEVKDLKAQLNSYKNSAKSGRPIIKYISQKGATGRGVSSVSATTTGFVINYTDNTSTVVPYSTTTILNVVSSGFVCFRDLSLPDNVATTTPCLDRDTVLKLISK
ncbi:MAG: hypothetical protein WCO35_02335 [Candidatus Nomurabacteria bacterium]